MANPARCGRGARALVPSLGDVLFDDPEYLRGHADFSAWLCARLLGDGSTPPGPKLDDAALQARGRMASRVLEVKGAGAITEDESTAIHRVLTAMQERVASGSSAELTEQSRTLQAQCSKAWVPASLPSLPPV
jgi:hypothetical protein